MKNVLAVPIIVSLTVIVLVVISQQVTMALYFLRGGLQKEMGNCLNTFIIYHQWGLILLSH